MSLIWECLAVRGVALTTLRHSSAVVGDNIYVYGGLLKGNPTNDLMVFNTGIQHPTLESITCSSLKITVCVLCVAMTFFPFYFSGSELDTS